MLLPAEIENGYIIETAGLRKFYEPVIEFDATKLVEDAGWIPGKDYLEFDEKFIVFHRRPEADMKAAK